MSFSVTTDFLDDCYEFTLYGRETAVRRLVRDRWKHWYRRLWYQARKVEYPVKPSCREAQLRKVDPYDVYESLTR